ncbi:MAG TPA: hypothetical protein VLV15_03645, partial [Dongiaceae bacterium]|nr:hypothetical protein [Dongiaceae bacterium]
MVGQGLRTGTRFSGAEQGREAERAANERPGQGPATCAPSRSPGYCTRTWNVTLPDAPGSSEPA